MPRPIAVGSIFIECNHFGGTPADLYTFRRSELLYGDDALEVREGVIGGMYDVLRDARVEIAPLLVASACPSGPVTAECYSELKTQLLVRLAKSLPVDGVLLGLHGAAAAENAGDLEGDLLSAVREIVGPDTPVVATLDLHAHITETMVTEADALLAWETYPHRDALETGQRGARALLDILQGTLIPTMALAKVPVMVSAIHGGTELPGPFAEVMDRAKVWERAGEVYSAGAILVHPYLDLPDMGGGGIVITNDNMERAVSLASQLATEYWDRRFELEPDLLTPDAAVQAGLSEEGQVLLVETADCCGGGAAGDSIASLRALLSACPNRRSVASVVDPNAAQRCHQAGVGADVRLQLGHQIDTRWGNPIEVTGRVLNVTDGRFQYQGGIWDGRPGDMGPSAVIQAGGINICIATHPTYEWCGEQLTSLGVDTTEAKFVVVKNPMNYHMVWPSAKTFVLDTPGPTPATLRHLPFRRLQRPFFPLDEHIENSQPAVYCGSERRGGHR
ncbi:MAG: M81 family metallopeptidase [Planctomycetota bacterium]|jgi:microcystin degradation protein MlrC